MEQPAPSTEPAISAKVASAIRRVARVWSILVFLLALILVIGTRNAPPASDLLNGRFDFLIPLALLTSLLGLGIAFRWEGWGALINLLFYLAVVPLYAILQGEWIHFSIMVGLSPVILPGVLFAVAWLLDRKGQNNPNSSTV